MQGQNRVGSQELNTKDLWRESTTPKFLLNECIKQIRL